MLFSLILTLENSLNLYEFTSYEFHVQVWSNVCVAAQISSFVEPKLEKSQKNPTTPEQTIPVPFPSHYWEKNPALHSWIPLFSSSTNLLLDMNY